MAQGLPARQQPLLRQRPTTNSPVVLLKAQRCAPFGVLTRKGDWLQVRHADGEAGWLHKSLAWDRYSPLSPALANLLRHNSW
ncbi:MAG: SH3 domain-containing protein [Thermodesulfobacteriota bacterium]